MATNECLNINHRRSKPPIRVCPNCGKVVNAAIPIKKCAEQNHAKRRKRQHQYCYDCGVHIKE